MQISADLPAFVRKTSSRSKLIGLGVIIAGAGFLAAHGGQAAAAPAAQGGRIVVPIPIFGCQGPGVPLPTPPPTPVSAGAAAMQTYEVCPQIASRVPAQLQQYALANPHGVYGYGMLRNPNVPANPWNGYRRWLSLRDMGKPWSECNSVVWKAGCP